MNFEQALDLLNDASHFNLHHLGADCDILRRELGRLLKELHIFTGLEAVKVSLLALMKGFLDPGRIFLLGRRLPNLNLGRRRIE